MYLVYKGSEGFGWEAQDHNGFWWNRSEVSDDLARYLEAEPMIQIPAEYDSSRGVWYRKEDEYDR